jgi:hypothetical protein
MTLIRPKEESQSLSKNGRYISTDIHRPQWNKVPTKSGGALHPPENQRAAVAGYTQNERHR